MSDQRIFRVYSIIDKGKDKDGNDRPDFWHNVGTAWPNKDAKGFNLELEVMPIPIDGKIRLTIREVEAREAAEEDAPKRKTYSRK